MSFCSCYVSLLLSIQKSTESRCFVYSKGLRPGAGNAPKAKPLPPSPREPLMLPMLAPRIPRNEASMMRTPGPRPAAHHEHQRLRPPGMRSLWGHMPASKRKCP